MKCGFASWVLTWDFVTFFPEDFPSFDWLSDLVQLLEYDCQAQAAQEAMLRKQSYLWGSHAAPSGFGLDLSVRCRTATSG